MSGSRTVTVAANTLTVGGPTPGPGGLTKTGAGTLVLSASNGYAGPTIVQGGTLKLQLPIPSGAALWLDAANASSLTASGSNLTAWNDSSGNGFNATSGGGAITGLSTINGQNAIQFNGSSNYLVSSGTYAGEMVFVVSARDTTGGNDYLGVISAEPPVPTKRPIRTPQSVSALLSQPQLRGQRLLR